jgi:prepilin-type N-terminal cleavage/methylation domain-containing protein
MTNKQNGFTLIELLITMTIVAILLIQSSLWLSPLLDQYTVTSDTNRLFSTLQFARSEAIKRNGVIKVCPSENSNVCSSDWSKGYIVFMDAIDEGHNIKILRAEKSSPLSHIHSGKQKMITYVGDGRCLSRSTFTISSNDTQFQKIVIYDSGRARLEHRLSRV